MPIDPQELWCTLRELAVDIGPRCPGTEGEKRAAQYIQGRFEAVDLETHLEQFPCPGWECTGASLVLTDGSAEFEVTPVMYSPGGEISGELVLVRPSQLEALTPAEVKGKVVFIPAAFGGIVSRNQAALRLESLGVAGLVATGSHTHCPSTKHIREPRLKSMPVVVVPILVGHKLAAHIGETVTLTVEARRFDGTSANVVAELPGSGQGLAILTAHYDSAPFIQGAGDNASGVAVLLALARSLSRETPSITIRFVAVGAEEFGGEDGITLGGKTYAAEHEAEMDDIVWVLNVDDVANAVSDHVVYVMRSRELEARIASVLQSITGVTSINELRGGSDHFPFAMRGVPAAWLTSAERPIPVHTALDTVDTLSPAKLGIAAQAAEAICRHLLAKPLASRVKKTSPATIRAATDADLEPIEGMLGSIWTMGRSAAMEERHGPIGGKPWQERVVPGIIANIKRTLVDGRLLVTELDGEVVGFIGYDIDRGRGIGTIGFNGVSRDAGGRGVGSRQLEHVLDIFRKEGLRLAEVSTGLNEGHRPARRMYERAGFKPLMEYAYYTMEL